MKHDFSANIVFIKKLKQWDVAP